MAPFGHPIPNTGDVSFRVVERGKGQEDFVTAGFGPVDQFQAARAGEGRVDRKINCLLQILGSPAQDLTACGIAAADGSAGFRPRAIASGSSTPIASFQN